MMVSPNTGHEHVIARAAELATEHGAGAMLAGRVALVATLAAGDPAQAVFGQQVCGIFEQAGHISL